MDPVDEVAAPAVAKTEYSLNTPVYEVTQGKQVQWHTATVYARLKLPGVNNALQTISAVIEDVNKETDLKKYDLRTEAKASATGRDQAAWAVELNDKNANNVLGIYERQNGIMGGPSKPVVVVRMNSDASQAVLNAMINHNRGMTIGEFVTTNEYRRAASHSKRNAQRLATRIAAKLSDSASAVQLAVDTQACPIAGNLYTEHLTVPKALMLSNCFDTVSAPMGKALFLDDAVSTMNTKAVVQQIDMRQGFVVSPVSPAQRIGSQLMPTNLWEQRESPVANGSFASAATIGGKQAWRAHVQNTFVSMGDGQPLSSSTPALWMCEGSASASAGAKYLKPIAVAIAGKSSEKPIGAAK